MARGHLALFIDFSDLFVLFPLRRQDDLYGPQHPRLRHMLLQQTRLLAAFFLIPSRRCVVLCGTSNPRPWNPIWADTYWRPPMSVWRLQPIGHRL